MSQSITNKDYTTPIGTIARFIGKTITILAGLTLIVAGTTDWISSAYFTPIKGVFFLGFAIWLLAEVLDLYGGQWSKKLSFFHHITTATFCLAALCYFSSIFGFDRHNGHVFLIIGLILEFILAGKMKKEERFQADNLNQ